MMTQGRLLIAGGAGEVVVLVVLGGCEEGG